MSSIDTTDAADTTDRTSRTRTRRDDRSGDERGFAMVWFGLVLVVLLTMAGAAIDVWGWWYNGNLHQRAADSAALAGVVFMPEDPVAARATALDIARANGVPAADVTIETSSENSSLAANELRVVVNKRISTRFLKLIGVTGTDVGRDATAQYTSRLPMGSPEQFLGRDPERGQNPGFWISVSGRGEAKVGGDRYQNSTCGATYVYSCDSGTTTEYSEQGYAFSVEMNSAPTGPIKIEVYDPVSTEASSQDCTNTGRLPLGGATGYTALLPAIQARYGLTDPFLAARYQPGDTIWCSGDVGGGNQTSAAGANITTFITREPDRTQASDFDNPPLDASANTPDSGCTRQFRGTNLAPYGSTRTVYQILAGQAGGPTAAANNATADALQAVYRRWVNVCTISLADAQAWWTAGTKSIIVQVRSNAELNDPFAAVGSTTGHAGRNHFALRAYYDPLNTNVFQASGLSIYAQGKLPLHNGAAGNSTTEFFVTRVPPGNAGRTLSLSFYDIADAAGTVQFQIVPPAGFGGSFTDCTFTRFQGNNNGTNSDVGLGGATATGCTISGMTNSAYNGRLVQTRIRVPAAYTCVVSNVLDCWIKVRVTYNTGGGQVFDHTTWDAGVVGEPVRLIE